MNIWFFDLLNQPYDNKSLEKAIQSDQLAEVRAIIQKGVSQYDLHKAFFDSREYSEDFTLFCLNYGAEINLRSVSGATILARSIFCIENVSLDFIETLLDRGAQVECVEWDTGFSPLDLALDEGRGDIAALLIKRYTNINYRDEEHNFTPLISVLYSNVSNKRELVAELLSRGADTTLKDTYGGTALSIAKEKGDPEIIRMIEAHSA